MPERLYIPAAYVDEICPPGRATPDAWIGAAAGDVWLLATEEDIDLGLTLKPGEVVPFDWIEALGEVLVQIRPDGSYEAEGTVPAGVTHFWFGGSDILADSLDEFVSEWRCLDGLKEDGESILVSMSRWSEKDERYRFEIAAGGPRFVPLPAGSVAP